MASNKFIKVNAYRNKNIDDLIYYLFVIISFISFIVCLIKGINTIFSFLFLLPILFCLTCLPLKYIFNNLSHSLVKLLIIVLYFCRNVLTPLFMSLSNYASLSINFGELDVLKSVLLLSYETLIVFLVINYITKKSVDKKENDGKYLEINLGKTFKFVIAAFLVALIVCIVVVPDIQSSYKNLWTTDSGELITTFSTIQNYSAGTIDRLLYAFFCFFFTPMLIVIIGLLITFIRKKIGDNSLGVVLSFISSMLCTLWVGETSLITIFSILILLAYTVRLFRKKRRFSLMLMSLGLLFVFVFMLSMRTSTSVYGDNSIWGRLAKTFNAYIPGVYNVSGLWGLKVPSKVVSFYYDVYTGIPLRSLIPPLFPGVRLSDYFNKYIGSTIQILPFIGQNFYYFSIFAPAFSAFIVSLALKFEAKALRYTNSFKYLIYLTCGVILGCSVLIYDLSIIVSYSFRILLPMLFFGSFIKEEKVV